MIHFLLLFLFFSIQATGQTESFESEAWRKSWNRSRLEADNRAKVSRKYVRYGHSSLRIEVFPGDRSQTGQNGKPTERSEIKDKAPLKLGKEKWFRSSVLLTDGFDRRVDPLGNKRGSATGYFKFGLYRDSMPTRMEAYYDGYFRGPSPSAVDFSLSYQDRNNAVPVGGVKYFPKQSLQHREVDLWLPPAESEIVNVHKTMTIASGQVFDGNGKVFRWLGEGDCSQKEGMPPMFRLEKGATLRNLKLHNAPDGIHVFGDQATVSNVEFKDVCEDAVTVKGSYRGVCIDTSVFRHCNDKGIQANSAIDLNIQGNKFYSCAKPIRSKTKAKIKIMDNLFWRSRSVVKTEGLSTVDMERVRVQDAYVLRDNELGGLIWFRGPIRSDFVKKSTAKDMHSSLPKNESAQFKSVDLPIHLDRLKISQGPFGQNSHNSVGYEWNWDFEVPYGTNVHAVEAGRVLQVYAPNSGAGCSPKFADSMHNIKILHSDGTVAQYGHVDSSLKVGDHVRLGDVIALTAKNGFICSPHLHFGVFASQKALPTTLQPRTIPLNFRDRIRPVHAKMIKSD